MRYFDANATAPLHPAAREAWLRAQDSLWQNPASLSADGARARALLEECRARLAARLGADARAKTAVFTGGATEGNNAVLAFESARAPAGAAIVSAVEHPSVLAPAEFFFGKRLRLLPVDASGVARLDALEQLLAEADADGGGAVLVSVMAVNNETGVIQPLPAISALAARHGARVHCDATQAFGKMPPETLAPMLAHCDYVTGCAHKFGGPKGAGFLLFDTEANPHFSGQRGGEQEDRRRAGTVNTPAIAAMLAALDAAENALAPPASPAARTAEREAFEKKIQTLIPGAALNGLAAPRVWNTVSLTPPRHAAVRWIKRLEKQGFVVSNGSACSSESGAPSRVLRAMGVSDAAAQRTLRISALADVSRQDWSALADALAAVAQELDADADARGRGAEGLSRVITLPAADAPRPPMP
jgi:cysteine desulfurase